MDTPVENLTWYYTHLSFHEEACGGFNAVPLCGIVSDEYVCVYVCVHTCVFVY